MDDRGGDIDSAHVPWPLRLGRPGRLLAMGLLFVCMLLAVFMVSGFWGGVTGGLSRADPALRQWSALLEAGLWGAMTLFTGPWNSPVMGLLLIALPFMMLALALALLPAPALGQPELSGSRRSLRCSVAGAAILAGMITAGVLVTAADALFLLGTSSDVGVGSGSGLTSHTMQTMVLIAVGWLASGVVWALLLRRAGAHRRPGQVDRWVRGLFAGSALELGLAAPTYAFALRRDSCYCGWGSWYAIVAGLTSVMLLCGPWALLLATRKARMQWLRGACGACGYPLRTASPVCPECGATITARPTTQ